MRRAVLLLAFTLFNCLRVWGLVFYIVLIIGSTHYFKTLVFNKLGFYGLGKLILFVASCKK